MNDSQLKQLLRVFKTNSRFLSDAGWLVCEETSPKWWGGASSPAEVAMTAILVQQTTWTVVDRTLRKLRAEGLTSFGKVRAVDIRKLLMAIHSVGLSRQKARRLKDLAEKVIQEGGIRKLMTLDDPAVFLMSVKGIGQETADSIALFGLNRATIPVSLYTRRVLSRLGLVGANQSQESIRELLIKQMGQRVLDLKLLHAGLTSVGKASCKSKPRCGSCLLAGTCTYAQRVERTR